MPAEVTLPRTARIVPAVLLPASPCRVARLTKFARKRCPRFPSVAVIQPPAMADRAARSNPSRASSGRKSQHGGLGCPSRPAARRRKFAEAGRGTATTVRTPRAVTGEHAIYAECVAADGQRSRMRPGPMYLGTNPRGRQEASPRLQPMRLSAARPPPAGTSIPIRPAHPGCRLARRQPSAGSLRVSRPAASVPVERSRRTPINIRSGPPWVKCRKSLPHLHETTGRTPGTLLLRQWSPMSRDQPLSRSR